MQCSNCSEPALYVYDPRGLMPAYFCGRHVPSFLSKAAKSGQLKSTEYYESLKVSVLESMRPTSETTTSDSADQPDPEVAEVEEVVAPPRKRRNRRKAETTAPETAEVSDESSPEVSEADGED